MNISKLDIQSLKVFGIVWCASISYAFGHHYIHQTHFIHFPSMFNAYLQLYLQNYTGSSSSAAVHAVTTGSNFPFLLYIDLFLYYLTNLNTTTILLIPIGSILLPLAYLHVNKTFFGDYRWICILSTIYFVLYFVSSKFFRAAYVDAFALPAFIILFSCIKKIYGKENQSIYALISIIMLSFLVGLWHTMAFTATIFTVSIACISYVTYLFSRIYGSKLIFLNDLVIRWNLAIVSLVMLVYFKLDNLTPYMKVFISQTSIEEVLMPFIRNLLGQPANLLEISKYQYNYADTYWGSVYFLSNLGIHLISAFMLILGIIYITKTIYINKKVEKDLQLGVIFTMSTVVSQIVISILYSKTGTGFFYVMYIFPLIGAYLLNSVKKTKLAVMFLFLLILLSSLMTFSSYITGENGITPVTKYKDLGSSFSWIYDYKSNYDLYADFNVLYKYLAYESEASTPTISYQNINSLNYGYIVGDLALPKVMNGSYVAIDEATMSAQKPINIYSDRGLLLPKLESINRNENIHKIYNDGFIGMYQFKLA